MSEKLLLLSSTKLPALVAEAEQDFLILFRTWTRGWRLAVVIAWICFVVIGLGDVLVRSLAHISFNPKNPVAQNALAVGPIFSQLPASPAAVATPITPVRLRIPAIGVDAKIEQVGLAADGAMGTPSSFSKVAWYKDGPKPGQAGNAVMDGHVNNALTSAGVFEHLDQVSLGDSIIVSDITGATLTFKVTSEQVYAADAPTEQIFKTSGTSGLVLITCDGAWDNGKKEFDKRLVIYATLVR